jgi:HEAT repeat protein
MKKMVVAILGRGVSGNLGICEEGEGSMKQVQIFIVVWILLSSVSWGQENRVEKWIKNLSSDNPEVRIQAIWKLNNIAQNSADWDDEEDENLLDSKVSQMIIHHLTETLQDSNAVVRANAAIVLADIGEGLLALPVLIEASSGKLSSMIDEETRIEALWKLRWLADKATPKVRQWILKSLAEALNDPSMLIRVNVALVLTDLGEYTLAVPILVKAISDKLSPVKAGLKMQALDKVGVIAKKATPEIRQLAITHLVENLSSNDEWIKIKAASVLVDIGEYALALPILLSLLDSSSSNRLSEDIEIMEQVLKEIGRVGKQSAPEMRQLIFTHLIKALQSSYVLVRIRAALVLADLGEPVLALPILIESLSKKLIGPSPIADEVFKTLQNMGESAEPVIPVLIELISQGHWEFSYKAAKVLGVLGEPVAPYLPLLLKMQGKEAERVCISIVEKLGPKAMPIVMEVLQDQKWHLGKSRAIWVLFCVLRRDNLLRDAIVPVIPYIVDALQWTGSVCDMRDDEASWLLIELGSKSAPLVIEAFLHPHPTVREKAPLILIKQEAYSVIALIEALAHPNSEIRAKALEVLIEIKKREKFYKTRVYTLLADNKVSLVKNKDELKKALHSQDIPSDLQKDILDIIDFIN